MANWMTKATKLLSFYNVMKAAYLDPIYMRNSAHWCLYTISHNLPGNMSKSPIAKYSFNLRYIHDNLEVDLFVENNTQLSYLLILLKGLLLAVHLKYHFTASVYIVTNDYVVQW